MTARLCIVLFCGIVTGCSNPFSHSEDPLFFGVWSAQTLQPTNAGEPITQIAFQKEGRYFENGAQVGTYLVTNKRTVQLNDGSEEIDFDMQITYGDGARLVIAVRIYTDTYWEILVFNSNPRGPRAKYDLVVRP